MKSPEYQLEKALTIADHDPAARVAVFVPIHSMASDLCRNNDFKRGKYFSATRMEYQAWSGGVVRIIVLNRGTVDHLSGLQFSHVFVAGSFDGYLLQCARARWRSADRHEEEPMGFYTPYHVERFEDY